MKELSDSIVLTLLRAKSYMGEDVDVSAMIADLKRKKYGMRSENLVKNAILTYIRHQGELAPYYRYIDGKYVHVDNIKDYDFYEEYDKKIIIALTPKTGSVVADFLIDTLSKAPSKDGDKKIIKSDLFDDVPITPNKTLRNIHPDANRRIHIPKKMIRSIYGDCQSFTIYQKGDLLMVVPYRHVKAFDSLFLDTHGCNKYTEIRHLKYGFRFSLPKLYPNTTTVVATHTASFTTANHDKVPVLFLKMTEK